MILGHLIDGTQAEYVRIPFADTSLHHLPQGADEATWPCSAAFPDRVRVCVLNGNVKPGDTVAIVGSGPIGLATLLTAQFYSPAESIMIDMDQNRLQVAEKLGATKVIDSADGKAVDRIMEMTGGRGVDVIEAVGIPATFEMCQSIVAAGGHIANVGVHGKSAQLHLERLWAHNVTITTRLVDTVDDSHASEDGALRQAASQDAGHSSLSTKRGHEGIRHVRQRREREGPESHSDKSLAECNGEIGTYRAAASCRETRRKQACALQKAALECGSLLPPWFGEACFAQYEFNS